MGTVRSYKRTTKSGKVVTVKSHVRSGGNSRKKVKANLISKAAAKYNKPHKKGKNKYSFLRENGSKPVSMVTRSLSNFNARSKLGMLGREPTIKDYRNALK